MIFDMRAYLSIYVDFTALQHTPIIYMDTNSTARPHILLPFAIPQMYVRIRVRRHRSSCGKRDRPEGRRGAFPEVEIRIFDGHKYIAFISIFPYS